MSTPPPSSDDPRPDRARGAAGPPVRPSPLDQPTIGQPASGHPPAPPQPQYGQPQYGWPQYGQPGQHWGVQPGQQWGAQAGPPWHAQQPWTGQHAQFGSPSGVRTGQYWGPGHPAQPQPRDRTRTMLLTALVVLCVAIAGAVTALVFTLGSTVLDQRAVERAVAEQFEERAGVALDLDCPRGMTVASGEAYRCTGRTADGEQVDIEIRIADSLDGAYTWVEV